MSQPNPFHSILMKMSSDRAGPAQFCPADVHKRLTDPMCEPAYLTEQADHYPAHVVRHPNTPPMVLVEIIQDHEDASLMRHALDNPAFPLISLESPALYERVHSRARSIIARDALSRLAWERSGRYRKPKPTESAPRPTKAIYNAVLTYCARSWEQFAPVDPSQRRTEMLRIAAEWHHTGDVATWAPTVQLMRAQASRIRVAEPKRIYGEDDEEFQQRASRYHHIRSLRTTLSNLEYTRGRTPVSWLLHVSGLCIADRLQGSWQDRDTPAWADELEAHLRILQTSAFDVPGYVAERGLL